MFISEQYLDNLGCSDTCLENLLLQIEEMDLPQEEKLLLVEEVGKLMVQEGAISLVKRSIKGIKNIGRSSEKSMKNIEDTTKHISNISRGAKYVLGAAGGLASVALAGGIIKGINSAYRDRVHKNCAKFRGDQLKLCKVKTADYMVGQLRSNLSRCNKAKEPEKCKAKINAAITKYKNMANKNLI